jgi:hypothetical protein
MRNRASPKCSTGRLRGPGFSGERGRPRGLPMPCHLALPMPTPGPRGHSLSGSCLPFAGPWITPGRASTTCCSLDPVPSKRLTQVSSTGAGTQPMPAAPLGAVDYYPHKPAGGGDNTPRTQRLANHFVSGLGLLVWHRASGNPASLGSAHPFAVRGALPGSFQRTRLIDTVIIYSTFRGGKGRRRESWELCGYKCLIHRSL